MKTVFTYFLFVFCSVSFADSTDSFIEKKKPSARDKKIDEKIKKSKSKVFYKKMNIGDHPPKVQIVLDGSGSMGQILSSGKSKMYHSKELLKEYLNRQWKEKSLVSLRVYGARRKRDCSDIELLVNFREKSLYEIESKVRKIGPVGMTPLSKSIRQAVEDLKDYPGPKKIVVLTDGEDTCGGDPCETAKYLREINDQTTKFYTIGIGFQGGQYNLQNMKCLGPVLDAQSDSDLSEGLGQIDQDIFGDYKNLEVRSPNPQAQVSIFKLDQNIKEKPLMKFIASQQVKLEPGTYKAVVYLDPKFIFKKFSIRKKRRTILVVKGPGKISVDYTDKLLRVEVIDIHGKSVKDFNSQEEVSLPMGKYEMRIYHNPFYEKKVPFFDLNPGANHRVKVTDATSFIFKYSKLIGYYVYRNQNELVGKFLTNAKAVIKKGKYVFHVDKKCPLDKVEFKPDDEFKVVRCPKPGAKKDKK